MAMTFVICHLSFAMAQVREHVLLYKSVDQHGDSVVLSGKISVPNDPKDIILLPHYTIASNDEPPSTSRSDEAKYLMNDFVLIMPDYIGYGVTRDRVHPYLRGDLTARNCADMYFASLPILDSMGVRLPKDSINIVGYSQGGASALWTLKLLEEEYSDKVHVKQCITGSGPYDVAATYDETVSTNKVGLPMVIPMLVVGTSEAYDLHLKREMFLTEYMNDRYDAYVARKEMTVMQLYFKMLNHRVDKWLTAYGADKTQSETRRLYEGLLRSSLVHYPLDACAVGQEVICLDWRPKAEVYVFHSYKDKIVTFRCAEHLHRCWGDLPNVTYDFGNYGNHMRSFKIFYPKVKERLKAASLKEQRPLR